MRRFSKSEIKTIVAALEYGSDDRRNLSYCYGHKGPESRKAMALVKKFKMLRAKIESGK